MKTIYLDADFKCHRADDGTRTKAETDMFDGKCDAFLEGYRYVPAGEAWTRGDGAVFSGEMAAPWKDFAQLEDAQRDYEREQLSARNQQLVELDSAYEEGVNSV